MDFNLYTIDWTAVAAIIECLVIIMLVYQLYVRKRESDRIKEINQLQFFSKFVERYQSIMMLLPYNVHAKNFNYDEIIDKSEFLKIMRSYFDLCSEEYYLFTEQKINDEIWSEWNKGIAFSMTCPAFQIAWKELPQNDALYDKFRDYIESLITNNDTLK